MSEKLTARAIMEKLVSFPTVSDDSNLPLIEWVDDYLTGHGIATHRHYNETNDKAALFAHVGPEVEGGIVLSGHTDVVPVVGQPWGTDPFEVVEKDGKFFGRGVCDMKGFDALAIWAMVEAHYAGVKRPLQIALSYDEEIGCTGAAPLIAAMEGKIPKASAVIVGEPSMMQAVTGHKVNAIMEGARLIEWANEMNAENRAKVPSEIDVLFEPPWTTVHVGKIEGGTAHNITALDCHFVLSFRVVPGESVAAWNQRLRDKVAEIEAGMQAVRPEARIELEEVFDVPGLVPEAEGEAEQIVRRLTGDNATRVVSYGTEAGHFQNGGYSAVICGPGNIEQAHQPNEFLSVEQFEAGQGFMRRLLDMLRG
jgi:acetylornithine deacetylase